MPAATKLPLRPLGKSGVEVPRVVLGAMGFVEADEGAEIAKIHAALEAGISAIDTAPLYGFGKSERVVGRALARLGAGPRPLVLTKVGLRWDQEHGDLLFETPDEETGRMRQVRRDSRPASVIWEVEQSLERLGLETLDLVQVHWRDRHVPVAETMDALASLVHSGRVRAVGVSNFEADEIGEAARALRPLPLASLQSAYSLLERELEAEVLPAVEQVGAGFLCYSPLQQGLLTGAHGPERAYAPDDWRAAGALFSAANRALIARAIELHLAPVARAHEATVASVALAWLLARPGVSAVVAGASSPAQAAQNARAASLALRPEERDRIGDAFATLKLRRKPPANVGTLARRAFGKLRKLVSG